ncbi:hypothetical protein [Ferrovum myxofaciens]|uniref:hypothetical protein n=1 Tax=Ferrovum myxofaciens TaxID=416213 RepID=UPI00078554EF|nr:hypothetical protein [Ferrovum myxofaciens]
MYPFAYSRNTLFGIEVAQLHHIGQQVNLGNGQVEVIGGVDIGFPRHAGNRTEAAKDGRQVGQGYAEVFRNVAHNFIVFLGTPFQKIHQANAWKVLFGFRLVLFRFYQAKVAGRGFFSFIVHKFAP